MNRKTVLIGVVTCLVLLGAALAISGALDGSEGDAPDTPATTADASSVEATRPTQPVAAGSTLTTVTTPPSGTFAMADATKLGADAAYSITFSPYGYGPPQGGRTLVIRISAAKPLNPSAQSMDFNGRNVLALLTPGEAEVADGGTYTATLSFRKQGDLLAPALSGIGEAP